MAEDLNRRALLLSYFTVVYNIAEGVLSVSFGWLAGSIALLGFGLDSAVESISGTVMVWRFRNHARLTEAQEQRAEARATRLVAYTFFILAAYILYESVDKLRSVEVPDPSLPGMLIAAASLL